MHADRCRGVRQRLDSRDVEGESTVGAIVGDVHPVQDVCGDMTGEDTDVLGEDPLSVSFLSLRVRSAIAFLWAARCRRE